MTGEEKQEGYPIRAVARLTGLSIDTLRAWERRYEAVAPRRQGRGRLYSEADIERLSLLKEAVDRGHSIGRLAPLNNDQLAAMLDRSDRLGARPEKFDIDASLSAERKRLMKAVEQFDYIETDREISRLATLLSPQALIHRVVVPLMVEVGEQWHAGRFSIAHEHMISSILHNLLGSLIRLYTRDDPACTLIFATPTGEQHEFGIMTSAMLAARGGLGVIYLGASVPAQDLIDAAIKGKAGVVVVGVKGANGRENIIHHLNRLAGDLPRHIELWVGGDLDAELQRAADRASGRLVILESLESLETHLIRVGAQI